MASISGSGSVEYLTLVQCTVELCTGISQDPLGTSNQLFARRLVSGALVRNCSSQSKDNYSKANDIVIVIREKVNAFPKQFEDYLNTLNQLLCLQDVVKLVRAKYEANMAALKPVQDTNDVETSVIKANIAKLEMEYASLLSNVAEKLEQMKVNFQSIRSRIRIYINEDNQALTESLTILDTLLVLSSVTDLKCEYLIALEQLCREVGGGDKDLMTLIRNYKPKLAGFKATTKIIDYLREKKSEIKITEQPSDPPTVQQIMADAQYCHKLSFKLKSLVTEECLDYIDQLWTSLVEYLYLPSLPVLLKSICDGCIEVSWLIPTKIAQLINKAQAENNRISEIAKKLDVIRVKLGNDTLYVKSFEAGASFSKQDPRVPFVQQDPGLPFSKQKPEFDSSETSFDHTEEELHMKSESQSRVEEKKASEMVRKKAPAIGIDLGTSYSCVGVFRNGKVEIIPSDQGRNLISSFVSFTDSHGLVVGDLAKNQATRNPANTIFHVKRLIGHKSTDRELDLDRKYWPFETVEKNGFPFLKVIHENEQMLLCPEEISALILSKLKDIAEEYLDATVRDAVITVPATFNNAQRQSTRDAVTIAGFNVLRLISEPTAAAMAYGLDKEEGLRTCVVFDMGGGSLSVSVMVIEDGIFQAKATAGNKHLGGEDFDTRMVEHFIREFKARHKKDVSHNKRAVQRLRLECEKAKESLSFSVEAYIEMDSLFDGIDFHSKITRKKFEELNADIFNKILEPVERALKDAECAKYEVDEVVLVGGSTRIPKVQQLLCEFFNGKSLNKSVNPDEAVAIGAAIQAAIFSRDGSTEVEHIILNDICPHSLGIESNIGINTTMIKRNSMLPSTKKYSEVNSIEFTRRSSTRSMVGPSFGAAVGSPMIGSSIGSTVGSSIGAGVGSSMIGSSIGPMVGSSRSAIGSGLPSAMKPDDQKRVQFQVYEDEMEQINILGKYELSVQEPYAPVDFIFDVDRNGILKVTATEMTSGKSNSITIIFDKGLSAEDIEHKAKKVSDLRTAIGSQSGMTEAAEPLAPSSDQLDLKAVDSSELDRESADDVFNAVEQIAFQWQVLAINLQVKDEAIKGIEEKGKEDLYNLMQLIIEWLRMKHDIQKYGHPSWKMLAEAVMAIDYSLAKEIAHQHRIV